MVLRTDAQQFADLTARFDSASWRLLGAIAAEQALGRAALSKLSGVDRRLLDEFLEQSQASGLITTVKPRRGLGLTLSPSGEPLFALPAAYEQLALRTLAATDELRVIALETQDVLGARSVSELTLTLQYGELERFDQRFSRRASQIGSLRTRSEWLRATVCEPLDAAWLERTYGQQAVTLALRVLTECLDEPSGCEELLAWLSAVRPALAKGDLRSSLESTLCQHALLRGDVSSALTLLQELPPRTALGFRAATRMVLGDVASADQLLHQALAGAKRGELPQCGAATPILALLACARDSGESTALAKRLLSAETSEALRGASRAFRTLLRYLELPQAQQRRIDVHQVEVSGAWELLLTALTVHLHLQQLPTRANWSQHLVRRGVEWQAAGYGWLGKQTLLLAEQLSPEYCREELARQGWSESALHCEAGELSLWGLLVPRPEWQKALQALARVSELAAETAEQSYRVTWFVDMSDGSLNRPALQEFRAGAGGFSQGRRLALSELYAQRHLLPPEDVRVLSCTRETDAGLREFTPEVYEMLIGHPRVRNGARAQGAVEVVQGSCRIEAEESGGYVRVLIEPEGAKLGINVVPETELRLVVYRVREPMQRVIAALPQGVRVPKDHAAELQRVLAKLAQTVEVRSSLLGAERTVEACSTPCFRISPQAGAWLVQVGVRPFTDRGRFFVAGEGKSRISFYSEGQRLSCERDLELERQRVLSLIAECPTLGRDPEAQSEAIEAGEEHTWVFGEESVLMLLSELAVATVRCELEWQESSGLRLRGKVTSKTLHGRLRSEKGWYIATGGARVDEVTELALSELVHAPAIAGGRFLRLPSGDYVEIEKRLRRVIAALKAVGAPKRGKTELQLHPAAVSTLSELAQPDSGFELDAPARSWLERVEQLQSQCLDVPAALRGELRPYQLDGYRWLARLSELGLGACLADDMGLGKTVQLLALLVARGAQGPQLVVAPTSVCSNWVLETRRFAPSLTPVEYSGKSRVRELAALADDGQGKLVVCSYALLQQDQAELASVPWATAVLDEAQFIKNSESLRAQAAFRLSARQRIAATGTPVENHYGDLWSIFHFLSPGLLGDWPEFKRRFVLPIERDGSEAPEHELRRLVQPYILRRLKRDVLSSLPPVTEVRHEVRLSPDEALRYTLLRRQIHDKLFTSHGKRHNKVQVLAEITRLRRFCCHPKLVFPDAPSDSSKIETFIDLVTELRENSHRALVFSQYVDFLALVREQLDERRIDYEYLDGSVPQAERQARVDAFQHGNASLFLISLKAGGFGLNLTAADYVIHLDPWWNPAVEAQATDRAHRIGQERAVTVYRLVTKDTIEEQIVELHERKQRLARSLLEGGDAAANLSAEELVGLIEARSDELDRDNDISRR